MSTILSRSNFLAFQFWLLQGANIDFVNPLVTEAPELGTFGIF